MYFPDEFLPTNKNVFFMLTNVKSLCFRYTIKHGNKQTTSFHRFEMEKIFVVKNISFFVGKEDVILK